MDADEATSDGVPASDARAADRRPGGHADAPVPSAGITGATGEEIAEQMARIVHELRSPLAATAQVVDLLERTADQPPDPSLLSIARRQLDTGLRRVGQLLVLLSDESERRLQPGPHRLGELVLEHVAPRRAIEPDHHLCVEVDEELTVLVDRVAFGHVLDNLLANATRHAPRGSTVLLTGQAAGDRVHLRVVDQGPGMDAALREQAFEPFSRGVSGGAGLGLTIVRQVVDAHGGRVWIEEVEPRGTCVVVALPRAEPGEPPAEPGEG